jgi:signal transduction histidine kinase
MKSLCIRLALVLCFWAGADAGLAQPVDGALSAILESDTASPASLYFAYLGLVAALGAVNLILFIRNRDLTLPIFIFQSLVTACLIDSQMGEPRPLIPLIFNASLLILANRFMPLRTKYAPAFWLAWVMIGLQSVQVISALVGQVLIPPAFVYFGLAGLYVLLLVTAVRFGRRADRAILLCLIALSPLLLTAFIHYLTLGLSGTGLAPVYLAMGAAIEMVLMSAVLADRINQRRQQWKAEQTALLQAQGDALAAKVARQNAQFDQALNSLRETQGQLVQAERMAALGTLVAGVAHEINGPLGIAVSATNHLIIDCDKIDLARRENRLSQTVIAEFMDRLKQGLAISFGNLRRAAELVSSFDKVARDQKTEQTREIDLADYMADIVRSLEPILRSARIYVDQDIPPGLSLTVSPGALAQTMTNLAQNAVRHAFVGIASPTFSICARPDDDGSILLIVSDNGCGMSDRMRAQAFDPMTIASRSEAGTGLGLHIAYHLVTKVMKGQIDLQSAPGKGTIFRIRINPAAQS